MKIKDCVLKEMRKGKTKKNAVNSCKKKIERGN